MDFNEIKLPDHGITLTVPLTLSVPFLNEIFLLKQKKKEKKSL